VPTANPRGDLEDRFRITRWDERGKGIQERPQMIGTMFIENRIK